MSEKQRRTLGPFSQRVSGIGAALSLLLASGVASASSGLDSPGEGIEMMGRGNAWIARANDPLAVYANPAALAFQPNGVYVGASLMFMNRCFTRQGVDATGAVVPVSPGQGIPGPGAPGGPAGELCSEGGAFPSPQLAASFRLGDRFAMGVALVVPHAAGNNNWPESIPYQSPFDPSLTVMQPAPTRYMLVESDAKIINPTISVSYAATDTLSFGLGFIWGVALVDFVNFTEGVSPPGAATSSSDQFFTNSDVRAHLTAKDLFVPGLVLGGLWSATPNLDVAGWFKWQDAIRTTSGDLRLESLYWKSGGAKDDDPCANNPDGPDCNITEAPGVASLNFRIPMEAKLGLRYHMPRLGAVRPSWMQKRPNQRVRDPLSNDVFDLELNFTWANNSTLDNLELRFQEGIGVRGTPGFVPTNGDVPHNWRDVFGVRLGGDFVVIPNVLSLRAGGFFETKGQSDEYLNIDFVMSQRIGVGGGATLRLGPVDVSAAFQHTSFGTLDNQGKGAVKALSGDAASGFRSQQAINGGVLTASLNEVALAGTFRF